MCSQSVRFGYSDKWNCRAGNEDRRRSSGGSSPVWICQACRGSQGNNTLRNNNYYRPTCHVITVVNMAILVEIDNHQSRAAQQQPPRNHGNQGQHNRRPHHPGPKHKAKLVSKDGEVMGSDMYCLVGSEDCAEGKRKDWIIDSGASCPMTWQRGVFETYDKLTGSTVRQSRQQVKVLWMSRCFVPIVSLSHFLFDCVLHVPELSCNISSIRQITESGFRRSFAKKQMSNTVHYWQHGLKAYKVL